MQCAVTPARHALQELLWLATWNSGRGPSAADPALAAAHAKLLTKIVKQVLDHDVEIGRHGSYPLRSREQVLLVAVSQIYAILGRCQLQAPPPDAATIDGVKRWLDIYCWRTHRRKEIPRSRIQAVMTSKGEDAVTTWISKKRGPWDATRSLFGELGIVSATRLQNIVQAPAEDVSRMYGGALLRLQDIQRYTMKIVGLTDEAIDAALAKQPPTGDVPFPFGQWPTS
jgi:hypothetical protein